MKNIKAITLMVMVLLMMCSVLVLTSCTETAEIELIYPQDGESGVDTMPYISWNNNGTQLRLSISENSDLSSPAIVAGPLNGNGYQVSTALKADTKYYIALEPAGGNSKNKVISSFTTSKSTSSFTANMNKELTVFDFNYASEEEMYKTWTKHAGGDDFEAILVDSPINSGGKAVRINYDATGSNKQGWNQFFGKVPDNSYIWDSRKGISLYVESSNDKSTLRVIFSERLNEVWYADVKMINGYKGILTIPFSEFKCTCGQVGGGYGDHIMQLQGIKQVAIAVIGYGKGSIVIDDFRCEIESKDNRDIFEDTSGLIPDTDYEDFEAFSTGADMENSAKGRWKAGAEEPLSAKYFEIIENGINGKSLSVPKSATQIIHEPVNNSLDALAGMEFAAMSTGGPTQLWVQISDNSGKYSDIAVDLSESPNTYKLNFKDFKANPANTEKADLKDVRFIKFYIANNYDGGNVILDDIKFSTTEYKNTYTGNTGSGNTTTGKNTAPAAEYENFESYTDARALAKSANGLWKAGAEEPLSADNLKIVTGEINGKSLAMPKNQLQLIHEPANNKWDSYKGIEFKAKSTLGSTKVWLQICDQEYRYSEIELDVTGDLKTYKLNFADLKANPSTDKASLSNVRFIKFYVVNYYDGGDFIIDDFRFSKTAYSGGSQQGGSQQGGSSGNDNNNPVENVNKVPDLKYETFEGYNKGSDMAKTANGIWKAGASEPLDTTSLTIVSDFINGKSLSMPKTATQLIHEPVKNNWQSLKGIEFTAMATEAPTTLWIQIADGQGRYSDLSVDLTDSPKNFQLNFSDMKPNSATDGKAALDDVRFIKFYVASNYDQGEFIIDDIGFSKKAYVKEVIPEAQYENFEGYNSPSDLKNAPNGLWKAGAEEPIDQRFFTILDKGIEGKSLSMPKTATQLIHQPLKNNWSRYAGVEFTAKATGGSTKVWVQINDEYGRYLDYAVNITEAAKTFKLNFKDFKISDNGTEVADLSKIRFIKFYIGSNYDGGDFIIDNIRFNTKISTEPIDTSDTGSAGGGVGGGGTIDAPSYILYNDLNKYLNTAQLQAVWKQPADSTNGNPVLETKNGQKSLFVTSGTPIIYSTEGGLLNKCNALKITYYTLTSYKLNVAMYIDGQGDFSGAMSLEACSTDEFKTAVMRIGGGGNTSIANVQLKDFGADTYISKIEFLYDDSAPELNYTVLKNTITFKAVPGAEYSIDNGRTWQDSNVFTGLTTGKKYSLAIRYKASSTFAASKMSTAETELAGFSFGAPFTDNIVLQRKKSVYIWGYGDAGVEYTLKFNGQKHTTVAENDGRFVFVLDSMDANATGQIMEITDGVTTISINNVVVGEVWIVAGQSNIQMTLATTDYSASDIAAAAGGNIRLFNQDMTTAATPQLSFSNGKWVVADSASALNFSAIGYMFGANLKQALGENIPVGIVYAAQGGTDIESWISSDSYSGDKASKHGNYNGMIAPMKDMSAAGVIWYQGENNTAWANEYEELLKKLMADWRDTFCDDLYFMVVQLPKYNSGNVNWAYLREAQEKAVNSSKNADLIVTIDGGDLNNIHPTQKRYIATRSADMAMYRLYGGEVVAFPTVNSVTAQGKELVVTFNNVNNINFLDEVTGFEIAGADGNFHTAKAEVVGTSIKLTSDSVTSPVYARYSFKSVGGGNVTNEKGMPLAPFRTDNINTLLIDDFSSYSSQSQLEQFWLVNNSTVELVDGESDKAIKIIHSKDGAQASVAVGGSWKDYKSIMIRYKVSSNNTAFFLALSIGNDKYTYKDIIGNGQWQTAIIPISAFNGDVGDYTGRVDYVIVKPETGGWVIIDSITVIEQELTQLPGADAVDLTIDSFDSFNSDAELTQVWQPYMATVTSEVIDGANKGMKVVNNGDGAQAQQEVQKKDWSKHKSIQIDYQTNANGESFFVVLNIGDGNYIYTRVIGNGKRQTAQFKISDMQGQIEAYTGRVDYIIIKPEGLNKWVLVDELKLLANEVTNLPGADTTYEVFDNFSTYRNSAALQSVWSTVDAAPVLETINGENAMKIFGNSANVYSSKAYQKSLGLTSLRINYAANSSGTLNLVLGNGDGPNYGVTISTIPYVNTNGSFATLDIDISGIGADWQGNQLSSIQIKNVTGDFYISEITLGRESVVTPQLPSSITIDDFNSYADETNLKTFWQREGSTGTVSMVDGEVAGDKAMKVSGGQVYNYIATQDWSNYKSVSIRFRVANNGDTFSFHIADGTNYPYIILTGNGQWQTATFRIQDMIDAGGMNKSTIYTTFFNTSSAVDIDSVKLLRNEETSMPGADIEDEVFDAFTYADSAALQSVWSTVDVAPVLETINGENVMKIFGTSANVYSSKAYQKSLGLTTLTIRYAANSTGTLNLVLGNGNGPDYGVTISAIPYVNTNGGFATLDVDISGIGADWEGNQISNIQIKNVSSDFYVNKITLKK